MAGNPTKLRSNAVLLRNNEIGVSLETNPRSIQRHQHNGYYCSLNPDWLETLNIAEQSAQTLHSFSVGAKPVIVQQPAIIIQPADLLTDTD